MNATQIITAVMSSVALVALSTAKADVNVAKVAKMEIVSINKMVIEADGDVYVLRVGLTFQNGNPEAVKLRKGLFKTKAIAKHWAAGSKDPEVANLDIGQGTLAELELPGTANKDTKGLTTAEILVSLGPRGEATTDKIIALWNVVGNAENQVSLYLNGSAEIGQQLPNGWVFEQGRPYEVELIFEPKLQRRVLFQ